MRVFVGVMVGVMVAIIIVSAVWLVSLAVDDGDWDGSVPFACPIEQGMVEIGIEVTG